MELSSLREAVAKFSPFRGSRQVSIENHVFQSYRSLRLGIAVVAVLFPFLLWFLGALQGIELQDSWSAYYHKSDLTRDVFVGGLFAMGFFLIAYKGYSPRENWALNIGGWFAIGVAIFPMNLYDVNPSQLNGCHQHVHDSIFSWSDTCNSAIHFRLFGKDLTFHGLCALVFFCSGAFVALVTSSATLKKLGDGMLKRLLQLTYWAIGATMIVVPAGLMIANFVLDRFTAYTYPNATFWAETAGIFAFALYWVAKTTELLNVKDQAILDDETLIKGMGLSR